MCGKLTQRSGSCSQNNSNNTSCDSSNQKMLTLAHGCIQIRLEVGHFDKVVYWRVAKQGTDSQDGEDWPSSLVGPGGAGFRT